jgi:hypothetical protein
MSLWNTANNIDELQAKIASVKHVLELVASDLQDPHSGAVWVCYEMLDNYGDELELQVNELMGHFDDMKELEEEVEVLKSKQKKVKNDDY